MLPKNVNYTSKIESAQARSYRSNIQPQNGQTYSANQTIIINIPTRANLFLDTTNSYLKFSVSLTNTGADALAFARWDSGGASGLIQRLRVYHGSNLIEDIDQYNLLHRMMNDIMVSGDSTYGKLNILTGTRADRTVAIPTIADVTGISGKGFSVLNTNNGALLGTNIAVGASTATVDYCINLVSLIGSLCGDKYLPLSYATSAPLRVEIQLVDNALKALCAENPCTFSMTNVEYVASLMELSDSAMNIINSSNNGPLQYVTTSYANYQWSATIPNGTSTVSMPIPAKYSSLKSLFIAMRDASKTGVVNYFPLSSQKSHLVDYSFRVGSVVMPSKNPSTVSEFFAELSKAISPSGLSDLHHQPSIDLVSYSIDDAVVNNDTTTSVSTINSPSFYVGIDMENYSNASKNEIFSGYNTNTDDLFWQANFFNANITAQFSAFASFDQVLVFENGTIYRKF